MATTATPPAATRRADVPALLAAGVTVFFWASAFVSIRDAGHDFSAGAMALGRMLSATIVLAAFLLVRGEGLPPKSTWPRIAFTGVVWFGLYMIMLNWGEQVVDAGTAALIVNVAPILMAVLAGWLLREGFSRRLFAGLAVAFAGAIVVGWSSSQGPGHASLLGVVACGLAAVCYASGVVAQKPALEKATPLQATTFGAAIGAVTCLPFSADLVSTIQTAPMSSTLNVVYLGVFPTALAFNTWAFALSRTTAGRMGATTYVVPAIVLVLSWLLLDEVPGWAALAGGVLCLAGVAVARSRPRAMRHAVE